MFDDDLRQYLGTQRAESIFAAFVANAARKSERRIPPEGASPANPVYFGVVMNTYEEALAQRSSNPEKARQDAYSLLGSPEARVVLGKRKLQNLVGLVSSCNRQITLEREWYRRGNDEEYLKRLEE